MLILFAFLAITFQEELISIIFLSLFSIVLTTIYLVHKAPDVALAEAVIGTGLTTAIFMATISQIREGEDCQHKEEE
jgi:uncharacterized MnhB-related membrane protein